MAWRHPDPTIKVCSAIRMPMCCCMPSPMHCSVRRECPTSEPCSPTPTTHSRGQIRACCCARPCIAWRRTAGKSGVDCTVIAQQPKLAPYKQAMAASIASCLSVAPSQVNVKAKTAERLGPVGEGHNMEARAVALLWNPEAPIGAQHQNAHCDGRLLRPRQRHIGCKPPSGWIFPGSVSRPYARSLF